MNDTKAVALAPPTAEARHISVSVLEHAEQELGRFFRRLREINALFAVIIKLKVLARPFFIILRKQHVALATAARYVILGHRNLRLFRLLASALNKAR
jgi:hypothetical protein